MNIFVGSRDYYAIMAIMAFPYEWVSLFDIKKILKAGFVDDPAFFISVSVDPFSAGAGSNRLKKPIDRLSG